MPRIRWFDPEPDGSSSPVGWPVAATILATLFLNFLFWNAFALLWLSCSLPAYALLVGGLALLATAVFFMGPALAVHAVRQPLLGAVENSVGSIPALLIRLCCAFFLMLWIAALLGAPIWWWSTREGWWPAISTAALLMFLFVTGLQTLRIEAKLAFFTNKLALAILIAALIRVHDGWPAARGGFHVSGDRSWNFAVWSCLSQLSVYAAPLAFLAADFGQRIPSRRQIAMTGLMGVALPLFLSLSLMELIDMATLASHFYRPSLSASVAMALWSGAARSALPGRMMIAAITVFGAVRFGARAVVKTALIGIPGKWPGRVVLACFIVLSVYCSLNPYGPCSRRPSTS